MGGVQRALVASLTCADICLRLNSKKCVQRPKVIFSIPKKDKGKDNVYHSISSHYIAVLHNTKSYG
jgi:hypothetical protein